jgi:hypothetical protein
MLRFALATILIATLAGCGANHVTAFRTYRPVEGAPNIALIDAKQRAILAAPGGEQGTTQGGGTSQGSTNSEFPRSTLFCAEPSPDALSAISSSLSASFGGLFPSGVQVQAALAQALSETASQLGVRNATIQLLRDGLYRQCEAYLNGLIDEDHYDLIANKYVNAMVALLAIEQLAPVGASATTIRASDGGKVSTETSVNVAAKTPVEGKKEEDEPKPEEPDSQTEPEAPPGEGQPSNETPTETTTTEKVEADTSKDAAGGTQEQSGSSSSAGEAAPPVVSVNLPSANQRETSPHVARAVGAMVTWFLTKDTVDYCLRELRQYGKEQQQSQGLQQPVPLNQTVDRDISDPFVQTCTIVIKQQSAQQGDYLTALAQAGTTYGADKCSAALSSFWMPGGVVDTTNQKAITDAIAKMGMDPDLIVDLVNSKELSGERRVAGRALKLPDCE